MTNVRHLLVVQELNVAKTFYLYGTHADSDLTVVFKVRNTAA
jgi:hypothetical protein